MPLGNYINDGKCISVGNDPPEMILDELYRFLKTRGYMLKHTPQSILLGKVTGPRTFNPVAEVRGITPEGIDYRTATIRSLT